MDKLNSKENKKSQKLKWQFALENSNTGVWDYDAKTNSVFFSNESKQIIGFENDAAFGLDPQDWNKRVHPEDAPKYYQDFKDHLNGLYPIYRNEHRILCKDGNYKWISDIGKIVEIDEDGKAVRVIGTHTDITRRVEEQENLIKTVDLITEQNRKLKNFAHIVTHNLKEHSGNFESLLSFYDQADTNSEKEELMSYLKTLSQSLNKTIANLNEIVSVQSNKETEIKTLNINSYFERVLDVLEVPLFDNNATINNNIDNELIIDFSPAYLESIIQNLISNTLKYKHPERNPNIDLKSYVTEDFICITITDNGIGIDLNKFGNEIFGLYKTFHHNDNAEGVGLYLVKNQIESFGGKVTIESEVNKGSIFTLKFPNKKNQR